MGYRFIRTYWDKGYATEATLATLNYGFTVLQLPKIIAVVHFENLASLRVIEKCGMQFRKFEEVDGCPVNSFRLNNPSLQE